MNNQFPRLGACSFLLAASLLAIPGLSGAGTLEGAWSMTTSSGQRGALFVGGILPETLRTAMRMPPAMGGVYTADLVAGPDGKPEASYRRCVVADGDFGVNFICPSQEGGAAWLPEQFHVFRESDDRLSGPLDGTAATATFERQPRDPAASKESVAAGQAARKQDDMAEAERQFTRAIAQDPASPLAYNRRSSLYRWTRRYDFALADINRAIALQPDGSAHFSGRGLIHYETGRQDEAIADYTEAMRLQPNYAHFHYLRCLAHHKAGNRAKAVGDCRRTLELSPGHENALKQLGRMGSSP